LILAEMRPSSANHFQRIIISSPLDKTFQHRKTPISKIGQNTSGILLKVCFLPHGATRTGDLK
jgi:hypothetical protein